jgi:ATP-dependent helicase/nuclease subunit A
MALNLLVDPDTGLPTEQAAEISERYVEILVDEYQDANRVQDKIFEAVSRNGKNIIMVGDVKQSISRFRLAGPGIFLEKYASYADGPEEGAGRRINAERKFPVRRAPAGSCKRPIRQHNDARAGGAGLR